MNNKMKKSGGQGAWEDEKDGREEENIREEKGVKEG
jgi:hypothetical protein